MIRSGARDADVRKRIAQTDFRSIKEIVAEACPVPNERTVQRLKDAYKSYDFSLRLPGQSAPAPRYYDEQDVLFYARILTMLAAKGIYPPVLVQAAGGSTTSILPTTIDGPMTFVPEGRSSTRNFIIPRSEDEAKEIARSRNPGSLADAAEGQLPVLQSDVARPAIMAAIDDYEDGAVDDDNDEDLTDDFDKNFEKKYPPYNPNGITSRSQYDTFLDTLDGSNERQLDELERLSERRRETFALIEERFDRNRSQSDRDFARLRFEQILDRKSISDEEYAERTRRDEKELKDLHDQNVENELELAILQDRLKQLEWMEEMLEERYPVVVYQTREQKTAPFRRRFERLRNWARSLFVSAPKPVGVPPSPDEKVPFSTPEEKRSAAELAWRLGNGIRRRLRRSRLTLDEKYEVIEMLPPVEEKKRDHLDDDDELDDEAEFYPATIKYLGDLPEEERRDRMYLIKKIAYYLLLPITGSAVAGIALHKTLEGTQNDPLIDLFLALPKNSWFRELPFRCWAHIITLTPREPNFLLLQQVLTVLHYDIDVFNLWQIDRLMFDLKDRDLQVALAWFRNVQADVNYRAKNATELSKLIHAVEHDPNKLIGSYDACYICGANDRALNVLASYYSARPSIQPTPELILEAQTAHKQVEAEYVEFMRVQDFTGFLQAVTKVLANTKNYDAPWLQDVRTLYSYSTFRDIVRDTAFNNFLHEIAVNPMHYAIDAKEVVEDFVRRFTKTDADKLKFQSVEQSLENDKDIYGPTTQLIQAMREYRNDQKMDQLSYDFLNMRWDKHSAQVEYKNFSDAVQSLGLTKNQKLALFSVIGAFDGGAISFLDGVQKDLRGADDFPVALPSVGLVHVGDVGSAHIAQKESQGPNRRLLSQPPDVTNVQFIRTARYVLLPIGTVSFMMMTEEKGQKYMNLATLQSGRTLPDKNGKVDEDYPSDMDLEVWRKPVGTSDIGQYTLPPPQEWDMTTFSMTASISAVFLIEVLTDSHFSACILPLTVSFFSATTAYTWNTFSHLYGKWLGLGRNAQVGIAGTAAVGLITAVYGPTAVKDAVIDGGTTLVDAVTNAPAVIAQKVQGAAMGIGALVLLGAGAAIVFSHVGNTPNKRQKLT